jgi:uncharacterized delta-60 repeat protein
MKFLLFQMLRAAVAVLVAIGSCGVEIAARANQTAAAATNHFANCALSGPVGSVIVQPDGKIVIAGGGNIFFATTESGTLGCLNGTVARFYPDGSLDYSFGCSASPPNYSSVFDTHLAIRSDGRLLMTGIFHTVDNKPRHELAMLLPDGKLDEGFIPWRGHTNELVQTRSFHPPHFHLATFDANGHTVVPCLKQNPATAELRVYQMDDSGSVLGTLQPDWAGGKFPASLLATLTERGFWLFRPVDWERSEPTEWSLNPPKTRNFLSFFTSGNPLSAGDAAEVLRAIFAEVPLELCRNAVRLPDGGAILLVQDGDTGRFMRFDKDWRPDLSYTNNLRARGYLSLALQKDGKLLVARGSDLWDLAGGNILGAVRLNVDGSIDRSFRCETDERVMCLAVQDDGQILIGGFFGKVNGVAAPWFARLKPDGAVDPSFQQRFTNFTGLTAGRHVPVKKLAAASGPATGATPNSGATVSETPANSILITSLTVTGGTAVMQFQGEPNHVYILQARNALDTGEWFNVTTIRTDANGSGTLRDPGAKDSPIRFYRVAAP